MDVNSIVSYWPLAVGAVAAAAGYYFLVYKKQHAAQPTPTPTPTPQPVPIPGGIGVHADGDVHIYNTGSPAVKAAVVDPASGAQATQQMQAGLLGYVPPGPPTSAYHYNAALTPDQNRLAWEAAGRPATDSRGVAYTNTGYPVDGYVVPTTVNDGLPSNQVHNAAGQVVDITTALQYFNAAGSPRDKWFGITGTEQAALLKSGVTVDQINQGINAYGPGGHLYTGGTPGRLYYN